MKKRLMILVGLLVVLLAVAIPALAQEASPPPTGEEVAVTGVVEIAATDGTTNNDYGIVDEASGQGYFLKGDANFGAFEGQRVTAYGVEDPESALRTLNVSRIVPAQGLPPGPSPDRTATPSEATTPDASGSGSPGSSGGSGSSSSSGSDGTGKSNPTGGSSSGGSSSGSGGGAKAGGAKAKELPRTGGATLPALGLVGALLVGGGLLVRRAAR